MSVRRWTARRYGGRLVSPDVYVDFVTGRGLETMSITSPSGVSADSGPYVRAWSPNGIGFVSKGAGAPAGLEGVRTTRIWPVLGTPTTLADSGNSVSLSTISDTAPNGATVSGYEITLTRTAAGACSVVFLDASPRQPAFVVVAAWIKAVSGTIADVVIEQGDQSRALAGAVTGSYRRIVVSGHTGADVRRCRLTLTANGTVVLRVLCDVGWYPTVEEVAWGVTLPASRVIGSRQGAPLNPGWYTDPQTNERHWTPDGTTFFCWTQPGGAVDGNGVYTPALGAAITTGRWRCSRPAVTNRVQYSANHPSYGAFQVTQVPGVAGLARQYIAPNDTAYGIMHDATSGSETYFAAFILERTPSHGITTVTFYNNNAGTDLRRVYLQWDNLTFSEHFGGTRGVDWDVNVIGNGPNGGPLVVGWIRATGVDQAHQVLFNSYPVFYAPRTGRGVIYHHLFFGTGAAVVFDAPIVTNGASVTRLAETISHALEWSGPFTVVSDWDARDWSPEANARLVATNANNTPLASPAGWQSDDGTPRPYSGLSSPAAAFRAAVRRQATDQQLYATNGGTWVGNGGAWSHGSATQLLIGSSNNGANNTHRRVARYAAWRRALVDTEVSGWAGGWP